MMMQASFGFSCDIFLKAASPFNSGMLISITTKSGLYSRAISTAWAPFMAIATTSMLSINESITRVLRRVSWLSSAINTLFFTGFVVILYLAFVKMGLGGVMFQV